MKRLIAVTIILLMHNSYATYNIRSTNSRDVMSGFDSTYDMNARNHQNLQDMVDRYGR